MTLSAIGRNSSLVEDVCLELATEIRGDLNSDDGWLPPERELAEQLGVSRTVVREATKRLELQGLLEVRHGIGIKVVDKLHKPLNGSVALMIPDVGEQLRQLTEARLLVEPGLARLAAERATPRHLAAMRRTQAVLMNEASPIESIIEADLEFHRQVALAAGNEICALLLQSLAEVGRESRKSSLAAVGKGVTIEHHSVILAAIAGHDGSAAFEAMRRHLEQAVIDVRQGLKIRQRNLKK